MPDDISDKEEKRVAALMRYRILDTAPEKAFDDFATIAALACHVPTTVVSFIDSTRQWYKSKIGIEAAEVPLESSFCQYTIKLPHEVLIVPDATKDERFKNHPMVTGGPGIRFYLGAPITTNEGYAIGTICAIDFVPREVDPRDITIIEALTRQTIAQLELRLHVLGLEETAEKQRMIEAELREATKAKSYFLANMSHEIRTPLTSVIGFAQILEDWGELDGAEVDQAVQSIRRNSNHLLQVVNDVLDYSKIEANELQIEHVKFSIQSIMADLESFVGNRPSMKGLEFKTRVSDDLPQTINSDPTRIKQILFNLVGNAIKFTEKGSVLVSVTRSENDVIFSVRDTGIGLTAESQKKLFKPFVQGEQDTTRKYGGTGLGLAISKELTKILGATLSLESTLGVGSCFTLTLSQAISD